MQKISISATIPLGLLLILLSAEMDHMPIIEIDDFTRVDPLVFTDTVAKSIATYA